MNHSLPIARRSAFAPSWDEIGQLAALAAIRAFVNYFLEHDMAQQEKRRD
jgi:uncharacterized membrane protein